MFNEKAAFLDEQTPPPYAPKYEEDQRHHSVQSEHTFDHIQHKIASEQHSYEVSKGKNGASFANTNSKVMLEVKFHEDDSGTDLVMFSNQHQVARARLGRHQDTFYIRLDPHSDRDNSDGIRVLRTPSTLLHSESYHFFTDRKLAWRHTHNHSLGASIFSNDDWKLMDETKVGTAAPVHSRLQSIPKVVASGEVMAVYIRGHGQGRDRVEWKEEFGDEFEMSALLVLAAIWHRIKKN